MLTPDCCAALCVVQVAFRTRRPPWTTFPAVTLLLLLFLTADAQFSLAGGGEASLGCCFFVVFFF